MKSLKKFAPVVAVSIATVAFTGCENLPGGSKEQGAVIGGAGGAAVGAAVAGSDHRLLGALIGAAVGAGGGYLIGAQAEKVNENDHNGAQEAVRTAQKSPATADQARTATTADINSDGFVTMDEVIALEKAGFTNQEIIDRLRATGQVFELTEQQRQYLTTNGVDLEVVQQMEQLNREARDRLLSDTISRPPTGRSDL